MSSLSLLPVKVGALWSSLHLIACFVIADLCPLSFPPVCSPHYTVDLLFADLRHVIPAGSPSLFPCFLVSELSGLFALFWDFAVLKLLFEFAPRPAS